MTLVGHKAGMTNVVKLAELTKTLTDAYRDPIKWTKFKQSLKAAGKGLIALKSGAALLIDNKAYAAVKAELVSPKSYPKRTVRVALETDRNMVLSHTWAGSLDRLCAEVQDKFGGPKDLEVIFREADGKFVEVARDEQVAHQEVLYFAPRGVSPDPAVTFHVNPDPGHTHDLELANRAVSKDVPKPPGHDEPPPIIKGKKPRAVPLPHPMETRSKKSKLRTGFGL